MIEKACKNCKWCNLICGEPATCDYKKGTETDYVTGKTKPKYQMFRFCNVLRTDGILDYIFSYLTGFCGPQGRYFERKSAKK